jgi:hypothetical protein
VAGSTVDHSLPPSAKLKKEWRCAFNLSYVFMARIQKTLSKKRLYVVILDEVHTVCVYTSIRVVVHNSLTS